MRRLFLWCFLTVCLGCRLNAYNLSICTDQTHVVFIGQGINGQTATLYYDVMVAGTSYTVTGFIAGEYYYIWFDAGHAGLMNDDSSYPANIGANIRPGLYPYSAGVAGGGGGSYISPTGSCSGAPVSFTKAISVTNNAVTVEQFQFNVPAVGTNAAFSLPATVGPGEVWTWNVTTDYEWTNGQVQHLNQLNTGVGLDGQIINSVATWSNTGPTYSTGSADGTYTAPVRSGAGGGANVYSPGNTATTLGTQPPPSNPTPSTGGTSEANADARHLALRNLLVGISNNQRDRDAALIGVALSEKASTERLDADVRYGLSNVVNSVDALRTNLSAGSGNSYSATNGAAGTFSGTGRATTLAGLGDVPTIGAGDPPMIVAPLDALAPGVGLPDFVLDFGDTRFGEWVNPLRAFMLAVVTVGFGLASLRMVGRIANV